MALSAGLRSSLGDNSGFIKSQIDTDDPVAQVQADNARTRLQAIGIDTSPPKSDQNFLLKALDFISRPSYGANNLLREFTDKDGGITPVTFDPFKAFMRGLTGEEKTIGKDVIEPLGFDGTHGIFGGEAKWYNPSAAGMAGLALDIFNPLDPVNWLGFGVGDDIIKGAAKGMKAVDDAFGVTKGAQIADILGKVTKATGSKTNLIDDLGADTVGKLMEQLTERANGTEFSKQLAELMTEGLTETGKKATSRLDYRTMKPLQIGLQNPLTIGDSGMSLKLPGYKASGGKAKLPILYPGKEIASTFRNIPGSEHLTYAIGRVAEKVANTGVGQALGKMFSTAFVPSSVPNSIIKKDMTVTNLSDLVNLSRTQPVDVPLSIDELMKLTEDMATITTENTFDYAPSFTATELKQLNKGQYLSLTSLAKKTGLKGFTSDELLELLGDNPFGKTVLDLYDQLRVARTLDDPKTLFNQAARLRKVLDLMYDQIPEGLKPLFTGVIKPQMSDLYPTYITTHRLGKNTVTSPLLAYEFNYKGVPVSVVVNSGENFNDNAWAKLASAIEALDELPETAIQAIKGQIDISPIPIKNPDTSMTIGDTIVLGRIDKPTVAHEYGHIWDYVAGDQEAYIKAILQDAGNIDDVITPDKLYSDYARSLYSSDDTIGIKEDLADSVSDYMKDRKSFSQQYPGRSAEIERMLGKVSIPQEELAKMVASQRQRAEQVANIPRTEQQIKTMIESVDQYAHKLTFEAGKKEYSAFRENLSALFEQTNWKTKEWKQQVDNLFRGLSEAERKQIMDVAAQITGTEVPKAKPQANFSGQFPDKINPSVLDFFGDEVVNKALDPSRFAMLGIKSEGPYHKFGIEETNTVLSQYHLKPEGDIDYLENQRNNLAKQLRLRWDNADKPTISEARELYKEFGFDEDYGSFSKKNYTQAILDNIESDFDGLIGEEFVGKTYGGVVLNENAKPADNTMDMVNALKNILGGFSYPYKITDDIAQKMVDLVIDNDSRWGTISSTIPEGYKLGIYNSNDVLVGYSYGKPSAHTVAYNIRDILEANPEELKRLKETLQSSNNVTPLFSQQDFPVFMSKLQEVTDSMPGSMSVEQFRKYLENKGVKKEEMKWTFIDELLEGREKISKAEVQDWVRGNALQVEEVWKTDSNASFNRIRAALEENGVDWDTVQEGIHQMRADGDPDQVIRAQLQDAFELNHQDAQAVLDGFEGGQGTLDEAGTTKFSKYTQPGGEEYTELIFTLPNDYNLTGTQKNMRVSMAEFDDYEVSPLESSFNYTPHWDEDNPVAHTRFDTRYTEDGKKVLFIDEIQSDWHQQGRDRGYIDGTTGEVLSGPGVGGEVPDAPFKTNWDEYVQKRLLRYAADNGYDGIAWSTGRQQADRWGQAVTDNIDTLQYNQTGHHLQGYKNGERVYSDRVKPENLSSVVGNDIARKLLDKTPDTFTVKPAGAINSDTMADVMPDGLDPQQMMRWIDQNEGKTGFQVYDQNGNAWGYIYPSAEKAQEAIDSLAVVEQIVKTVSGTNITVGGEGMRKFYDQQIPSNFSKIGKKFGLKVDEIQVPMGTSGPMYDPTRGFYQNPQSSKQQGIWLGPESRTKITQQSFPLFADNTKAPVDELTAGWSEREIAALDNFLKWRNSIVKQYRQIGIPLNELEKYVPFIPMRTLKKEEASALRSIFGTGVLGATADNFDTLMTELSKFDPNLKARTTQATRPGEVNKLLNKSWLTEDAAVAMSIRGTRAIKAKEFSQFADDFVKTYGMSMEELGKIGASNQIPEGYKAYQVGVDEAGTKVFKQVGNIPQVTEAGVDTIFLPEDMVNLYNEYSDLVFNKEKQNGLLKVYDSVNRMYKKAAYLWNPGHIFRDFQGNVFNNFLMGVTNPEDYVDGFKVVRGAEGVLKTPNGDIPYKQIREQAEKLGIIDSQMAYEVPTSLSKKEGAYTNAMRKATYATDGWTRATGFVYNLKNGMNFTQAATNTKKFLFDYMDLTAFERKVMKRIVPFYTWMRKNIPLQVMMLLKNPRTYSRINDIQNAAAGESIDWSSKPEYIRDSAAVKGANSNMYMGLSMPYVDLANVPTNLNTAGNLLSSVSPIIRAPIESVTNQKWWTGRKLEDYRGEKTDIPVLTTLMEKLGAEKGPQVDARITGNLLSNIPLLTRAGNLVDSLTGKETSETKNLSRLSTTLGGPTFYDASSVENSADWEERNRLVELIKLLQDSGMNVPTIREIDDPRSTRSKRLKAILGGN